MDDATRKQLYGELKEILENYQSVFIVSEGDDKYSLSTSKPISVNSKTQDGIFFAGLRELKGTVGFYFMPIYTDPELLSLVPVALQKSLKGKSCFNIKALTPEMKDGISKLMQLGIKQYKEKGWI